MYLNRTPRTGTHARVAAATRSTERPGESTVVGQILVQTHGIYQMARTCTELPELLAGSVLAVTKRDWTSPDSAKRSGNHLGSRSVLPYPGHDRVARGTFGCVIMGGTLEPAVTVTDAILELLDSELTKVPLAGAYHQCEIAMEQNDGFGFR